MQTRSSAPKCILASPHRVPVIPLCHQVPIDKKYSSTPDDHAHERVVQMHELYNLPMYLSSGFCCMWQGLWRPSCTALTQQWQNFGVVQDTVYCACYRFLVLTTG